MFLFVPLSGRRRRGASLPELLVAFSLMATVAILTAHAVGPLSQTLQEIRCRENLHAIHDALERYRSEHRGQDPVYLHHLVPEYLREEQLVCPVFLARAPQVIREQQALARRYGRTFDSYTYCSPPVLNNWARIIPGTSHLSYTALERMRGPAIPIVICREHREAYWLEMQDIHGMLAGKYAHWVQPQRANLVLRRNGRVDATRFGGLFAHLFSVTTEAELLNM
jgi:type II secretory pathway pseudopilin PulG